MSATKKNPKCPKCGSKMVLKTTDRYTYPSGDPRKFFSCSRHPECNGILAAHPNGTAASSPADWETRKMRQLAHQLASIIWGKWNDPHSQRKAMYRWLERHTKSGHIGYMQKEELTSVISRMYDRIKSNEKDEGH